MADQIPDEIINLLACPVCKGSLEHTNNKTGVRCSQCKIDYPVEDGIPILLPPKQ
jgi:uncharacterized protein YbaR (Trm112 family)